MADMNTTNGAWLAKRRFARMTPRKARLVMDLVRGLSCRQALDVLAFNPRLPAVSIRNLLKSAMASANDAEANMNRLYIVEARVDEGPTMNRWRPKDRGRAHPILKRTSHLILRVAEK